MHTSIIPAGSIDYPQAIKLPGGSQIVWLRPGARPEVPKLVKAQVLPKGPYIESLFKLQVAVKDTPVSPTARAWAF